MYLKFEEVILVQDKKKLQDSDPVVYLRKHPSGEEVLALDGTPDQRYGKIYYDSKNQPCIVPDRWSEQEALRAKNWQ